MNRFEIPAFTFMRKDLRLRFNESVMFCCGEKCFLLDKMNGGIILFEGNYLNELLNKDFSDAFVRKLISRGFVGDTGKVCGRDLCEIHPEVFMIDLTNKCNMRCRYCLRDIESKGTSISRDVLVEICQYISEYCEKEHIKHVSIQPWGGEPLLEMESIMLMRKLICPKGTKVHFSIETNGVLLTREMIVKLYENMIGIGISIDGYSEVHDKQRVMISGEGTHEIVEKNLLLSKEIYGDNIGIIATLTKNTATYIEEILEYFVCKLGLKSIKFNFVHDSLFSDDDELCLTDEQISETELKILKKLVELNERGYNVSEYNLKIKLINLLTKKFLDICHSNGCCGGRRMIVFDFEGNIYPCELTDVPSEKIGSIYDERDLMDIVSDATNTKEYFIPKKADKCLGCEWYVFCRGGCTVRVLSCGKRPPEVDEIECAVNRALYPALVELILTKPKIVNALLEVEIL